MDEFIKKYCKLLSELDNYKNKLLKTYNKNYFISDTIYLKHINEIDDFLFNKYLKIERLINNKNKK